METLTTRRKQAFAAFCLAKFCAANDIRHRAVTELIEHLISILVCDSLPTWVGRGALLELSGRGYPLPESLEAILPEEVAGTFDRLHQYVVEVGLVDIYGASTEEPLRFALECIRILEVCGVAPPSVEDVFGGVPAEAKTGDGWGDEIGRAEYERILAAYAEIAGTHDGKALR